MDDCAISATTPTRTFQTPRNAFGLSRLYHSEAPPAHDPEDWVELQEVAEDVLHSNAGLGPPMYHQSNSDCDKSIFYPYPNKSSFLLGEWYWGGGAQKSRESFSDLIDIVGSSSFRPEDVQKTKWAGVDRNLAHNTFDGDGDGSDDGDKAEWVDEDAGWQRTPIKISVPFHSRTKRPGPQTYEVGHLYHRSLVSVIREKLANEQDSQHFHYEPYELFWKPSGGERNVRVYGELYTSPAFVKAHQDLQNSPREPGCNLPRVVAAMMFWSDVTHLTSFGTAKLWPCYLFFGNESKYRRSKPSYHLCNHVAYFQSVRHWQILLFYVHFAYSGSPQMIAS